MVFLFGAGVLAAALNALAGGGSFVALPALIAGGLPAVAANASSTVALWPGGAASAWTYHDGFHPVCGVPPMPMAVVTFVGGLLGAILLLLTPASGFDAILPGLLLLATLTLAFGGRVGAALRGRWRMSPSLVLMVQFVLGLYGGYFGGAVGLMMLAAWSVLGGNDIKALQGPRTLLVTTANSVATLTFILAGAVRWPQTLAMLLGGLLGGTLGARLGRVVPSRVTRVGTLCFTTCVTVVFFARAYL